MSIKLWIVNFIPVNVVQYISEQIPFIPVNVVQYISEQIPFNNIMSLS